MSPDYPFNIRSKDQGSRVQKHISLKSDRVAGVSLHSIEYPSSSFVFFYLFVFMKNGRGRTMTDSVRSVDASRLPKFMPSKTANFGDRGYQAKPMIWQPPSSLMAAKLSFTERPVSAPPYRGQPPPVAPSWDNYENDNGRLEVCTT